MRQNPSFALSDVAEMRRLIERNPWTTLVSATDDGVVASHYPVMLDDKRDDLTVVTHVGKPDDLILDIANRDLTMIFMGPHGYITPRWYGDVQAVPTWNYIGLHLTGRAEILSTAENLYVLDRLVDHFENLAPEPRGMWKAPNDEAFVNRLERGTVGIRLTPTRVVAKRKLSQNKTDEMVDTIIAELNGDGVYANPQLAAEMARAHAAIREARA